MKYSITEARELAGMNIKQCAAWFEKSVRTIQRWEKDAPYWAVKMMELKAGDLGHISKEFSGWRIRWGKFMRGKYWPTSMSAGELNYLICSRHTIVSPCRVCRVEKKPTRKVAQSLHSVQ